MYEIKKDLSGETGMAEKILQVQMFGGFAMYYGGEAVILNKAGSSKSIRLLQMMFLSMPEGILKSEIIDALYGWNEKTDTGNRNRNLNNLIYRLKGQMTAGGLPEKDYIEIQGGKCRFRDDIPVRLDTQEFLEIMEKAEKTEGKERMELLWRANEIYCGELLPANSADLWFYQKSRYFKELYIQVVNELEKELQKNRDYLNRLRLYSKVAAIYPFDNWQVKSIRCNLELYRYDEALRIYHETMELYAREMGGTPPTGEMQECFEAMKLMDENHRRSTGDAADWKDMDKIFRGKKDLIRQALFAEEEVKGAYYCTYPSFVDYCHMVVRAKERNEFSAVLMFLTLSRKKTKKSMDLPAEMDLLKEVLSDNLRIGDAYTRYGNRHFILMLMKTNMEFCSTIFGRIEEAYNRRAGRGDLWYYADMTQELKKSSL